MYPRIGFTLVELLVVITIVIVLLALLAPALDKAVYQAELAVCGSRLKALGSGVQAYALGFNRAYPVRPALRSARERPLYLVRGANPFIDDRLPLAGFASMDLMLCPLDAKISVGINDTHADSYVWSNYALWYGWYYSGEPRGMWRMGDRFTSAGSRYSLLASDWDTKAPDFDSSIGSYTASTHPDNDNRLQQVVFQNVGAPKLTASWWDGFNRGSLDNNFAYDDGSVRRITDSYLDDDERLDDIPYFVDPSNNAVRRNFVPRE